jgi:hypothetical protein
MTEYADQDAYDSFMISAALGDPEPTAAQLQQYIDICLLKYGKHPTDLKTEILDELVQEILYPEVRSVWTDYKE